MSISYEMNLETEFLRVTAKGCDENLQEVMAYGAAILNKCYETKCTKVLCDERELQYRLNTGENFDLAAHLADAVPMVGKVAIVHAPQFAKAMKFFETVGVNRGLQIKAFVDISKAENWLIN